MGLTSAEEVVTVDEPLEAPPVEAGGGSSIGGGTILLVGLGVAGIAGAAFALSGSGSDDDSGTPAPPQEETDTTAPTVSSVPESDGVVDCTGGSISYSFSEAMATESGEVSISPSDFAEGSWQDTQTYVLSWKHTDTFCMYYSTSLEVRFRGYTDPAGNALAEPTTFGYSIDY